MPTDPDAFIAWFEALKDNDPARGSALLLACRRSLERISEMVFEQEAAGEAGFDDLVALTQIKLTR